MTGPHCPPKDKPLKIRRDPGSDEFGLAKETKTITAYPFYCESMSQNWDPDFDVYHGSISQSLRRRLEATPGSEKVLVVLKTEGEEPVPTDEVEFESRENVLGEVDDGLEWYYWVIIALSIVSFLLLIAFIVSLVLGCKSKNQPTYRSNSPKGTLAKKQARQTEKQRRWDEAEQAMAPIDKV